MCLVTNYVLAINMHLEYQMASGALRILCCLFGNPLIQGLLKIVKGLFNIADLMALNLLSLINVNQSFNLLIVYLEHFHGHAGGNSISVDLFTELKNSLYHSWCQASVVHAAISHHGKSLSSASWSKSKYAYIESINNV